jgi:hypothetical protein
MKKREKKLVIKIEELPIRVENLGNSKLHEIYGGCLTANYPCCNNSDCCSNYCIDLLCFT